MISTSLLHCLEYNLISSLTSAYETKSAFHRCSCWGPSAIKHNWMQSWHFSVHNCQISSWILSLCLHFSCFVFAIVKLHILDAYLQMLLEKLSPWSFFFWQKKLMKSSFTSHCFPLCHHLYLPCYWDCSWNSYSPLQDTTQSASIFIDDKIN